ncbi:MAG: tRNA pseudouridine(13) synthase TruD [Candidatus Obscuribacterales bacterium]|nr:tRNA pseudouridine(13) synthase TruD [Steroidobacteraceae bacterium]
MSDISNLRLDSLAYAYGAPLGTGVIRSRPEDFVVREFLGFEPTGEGEHLLLTVRKRGANTKWVAKELAKRAGVRARDVGFSGLKDRHAVTEQAFTLIDRVNPPETWQGFTGEGFEVVGAARQRRKLRRGAHRGNDFEIVVREFDADAAGLAARLDLIASAGVPNYFGAQRFGRNDSNLVHAERWLKTGVPPSNRDERSFALSAARSALFNLVLSTRIDNQNWNRLLPGEVVNLDGSGSVFVSAELDDALNERSASLDIHPTGPLCGRGESRVSRAARELEDRALLPWREWCAGLESIGVEQQRRALRVAVRELTWDYRDRTLQLRFRLTRGAFATAVLREIVATTNADSIGGEGEDHD